MYRFKATFACILLLGIVLPLMAQMPALPTNHTREIFRYDLKSSTTPIGRVVNLSGSFSTSGWTPTTTGGQLRVYLNDYLPYEGTLEVKVTGLSYTSVLNDWTPFSVWSRAKAKYWSDLTNPTEGSFAFFKTDETQISGTTLRWKAVSKGMYSPLNSNVETGSSGYFTFSSSTVYTFRIVWKPGGMWFQIYSGATRLSNVAVSFRNQCEAFAYIYLGKNNENSSMRGIKYQDLVLKVPEVPITFQDVTKSSRAAYDTTADCQSMSWADVNKDGAEDIYLNYDNNRSLLMIARADSNTFTEQSISYGLGTTAVAYSSNFADVNSDSKVDAFISGTGAPHRLFINKGGNSFADETAVRGISTTNSTATNSLVFDMENDGDLDIYIANSGSAHELYLNNGTGNFTKKDITSMAPVGTGSRAVAGDVNGDNYPDVFYPRANQNCVLLINNKNGGFGDEASSRGLGFTTNPNSAVLADLDNDGDLDLILTVTSFSGDATPKVLVYRNNSTGIFQQAMSIALECYGAIVGDVDNDGLQDLYLIQRNKVTSTRYDYGAMIYRNTSTTSAISFAVMRGTGADMVFVEGRGGAMADYNRDGKLDIYGTSKGATGTNARSYGRNALLMNTTSNSNGFLKVNITDRNGMTSGLGIKIRVFKQGAMGQISQLLGYREISSMQGYQSGPSLVQHFGLGSNAAVDVLVELPNKRTFSFPNVAANTTLIVNAYRVEPKIVQMVKGNSQTAQVATTLPDSVTVRVLDIDNLPLAGQTVTFRIAQGGGALNASGTTVDVSTDNAGLARVAWTLGTAAGNNVGQLEVSSLKEQNHITGSPMTFQASATAAAASRLIKDSGDNQLGYAGDPLTNPIVARVTDVYNNPINNYKVNFDIAQGGGGLGASGTANHVEVMTGSTGTAQTNWALGSPVGTQKVNAYGAFNSASPAVFSATAQEPLRRLTYEAGDRQSVSVNQTVRDPIVARLKDFQGNPIVGGKVRFAVISGGGKMSGQTSVEVSTGTNGLASVNPTLGTVAGDTNNVFQATSAGAQGTVTYKITALAGAATQITEVSGNNRNGKVGRLLATPFVVRITDSYGNPVSGFQVDFGIVTGGGLVNGQPSARVATDKTGYASVYLRLGTAAGLNTVNASAIGLAGSPITFTATSESSSPALMYKISGDNQKGSLGQPLPLPFVVAVNDSFSNAIFNQPVTFRITKGDGTVDGQNSVTVNTNQLGRAAANFTLGTAGFLNEITINGQYLGTDIPTYPTPLVFTASAMAGDPKILSYVSGNYQIGRINGQLTQPFKVQVTDVHGVPIVHHEIQFDVIQGGGSFGGATRAFSYTDGNGVASILATVGSGYSNEYNNIYEARAEYNDSPLDNSPIVFYATGRRSTATHIVYVYGNNLAGTVGSYLADSLKVKALDSQEQPVPDHPITFEVLPGQSGALLNGQYGTVTLLTGANGLARAAVKLGALPGKIQIRASSDDGISLLVGSPIDFEIMAQIGSPDPRRSTLMATTPVIADGKESSKIFVTLRDAQGNTVPGKIVSIYTAGLEVRVNQPLLATDGNGQTQGSVSAMRTGTVKIWTKVDGQQVPTDTAVVTFKAGSPTRAVPFGSGQIALRGKTLPLPLGIYLYDANSNPVQNIAVSFRVKSGGGTIVQSQPMNTNADGKVQINWILGNKVGEQYLAAVVSQIGGSEIEFWAIATPSAPATMSIARGNKQIGLTNKAMPDSFVVAVLDSAGAPAEGLSVYFSQIRGQGNFLSPNPVATDRRGNAAVLFQPSSTSGEYGVLATLAAGLSVEFQFMVQVEPTVFLSKVKDAKPNARPGEEQELQIKVSDAWGQPVSGQSVKFEILEGGGTLLGIMPVNTDASGQASAKWNMGAKGPQKVKATPVGKAGSALLFTSTAINSAPTLTAPTEKKVLAGDLLTFNVSAYDNDGDPITFGARALPSGASFDSTNTRLFSWRPTRAQANKKYVVKFLARDQYSAIDTADVTITVEALNQAPSIDSFEPADTTLTLYYDMPITFKVFASDLDNDQLTYEWRINDLFAGSETLLIFQPEQAYFPADNIVAVLVSDGKVEKTLRWHVHLLTSVRISIFEAVPQRNGVVVKWQTAAENDNLGFKVCRSESEKGDYTVISSSLITATGAGVYSYSDTKVQAGKKYYYKLQDVDRNGKMTWHGPVSAEVPLPTEVALNQNYPNPFNPNTTITFELPQAEQIELSIFNVSGQRVRLLINGSSQAGAHQVVWDARDDNGMQVPSGVYYYRLVTSQQAYTKKLVFTK